MEDYMAGKIKKMLDEIIEKKSGGHPTLMSTTKTKLILKGLNPDKYSAQSADDPVVIEKVLMAAREMGVKF